MNDKKELCDDLGEEDSRQRELRSVKARGKGEELGVLEEKFSQGNVKGERRRGYRYGCVGKVQIRQGLAGHRGTSNSILGMKGRWGGFELLFLKDCSGCCMNRLQGMDIK